MKPHTPTSRFTCIAALAALAAFPVFAKEPLSSPVQTTVVERSVLEEYLAPSISLRYDYDFPMDLEDTAGDLSMHEITAQMPLFPVKGEEFFMLVSLYYRLYLADIGTGPVNGDFELHTVRVPIEAAWLSPATPWFMYGYLAPGLSTDFSRIDGDSFDLTASLNVGYRFSDRFVLAAGAYYTRDYGDDVILPSLGLLWFPCDYFRLEVSPVGIVPEWRITENTRLKGRIAPMGGRWTVDDSQAAKIEISGAKAGLELEHRLFHNCWLSVGAGWNVLADIAIEDNHGHEVVDDDLESGLYVGARLMWEF